MGGRTGLRRSTRLPLAVTVLLAVVGAIVAPSTAAHAAAGLTATFSSSDNGSWRMDKYVISNPTTTAISGWTLEFDLPAGVTMGNAYHGTVTRVGNRVTVVNAHYNGTVAAGGSTEPYSFWFIATGTAAAPTNCRVNGNKCDGSPDRAPGTPTGLTVSGRTTKTLSLTWAAATATDFPIAGYDVLRGGTVVASVTGTAATVGGLTPNTSYTFAVVAKDTRGNVSPASAAVSATTLNPADDTVAPPAPGGLRSTAVTAASVTLAWNAVNDASGIAGYDVYRGTQLAATVNGTGTSITVGGLTPLTAYTFTVRARDTYDNVSPASASVTVTTDDVMGAGRYAKVGYFVQWGIYGRQYFVKNLDTSGAAAKLTHINYAFANLDPVNLTCLQGVTRGTTPNPQDPDQGTGAGDADADYGRPFSAAQSVDGVADTGWEKLRGNFNQLKKLKAKHPHLKILISLGGWTYSKYFSDAAATPASREKLVRSCLDIYLRGNLPVAGNAGGPGTAAGIFDGIDLDWEWPGAEGHPGNHWGPQDKANNTALLAEFRRQMDELGATTGKRYLLTAFTLPIRRRSTRGGTSAAPTARRASSTTSTSPTCRGTTSTAPAATTRGNRTAPDTRATCTATRRTRTRSSSASNAPCGRTPTPGSTRASSPSASPSTAEAGRGSPPGPCRAAVRPTGSGRPPPGRHPASSPRRRAPAGTPTCSRWCPAAPSSTTPSRSRRTASPATAGSGGPSTTRGRSARRPPGPSSRTCSAA